MRLDKSGLDPVDPERPAKQDTGYKEQGSTLYVKDKYVVSSAAC